MVHRIFLVLSFVLFVVFTNSSQSETTTKPDFGAPNGPQDPKCPKNAYFRECSNTCPPKSCENIMEVSPCVSLRCGPPKCECKAGFVFMSTNKKAGKGECVRRETCLAMERALAAQKLQDEQVRRDIPQLKLNN